MAERIDLRSGQIDPSIHTSPEKFLSPTMLTNTAGKYPTLDLGDFAGRTHTQRVAMLNQAFAPVMETKLSVEPVDDIASEAPIDDILDTPKMVAQKLIRHRDQFRDLVRSHYDSSIAESIQARYTNADQEVYAKFAGADDETIRRERVRARLATASADVFITDLDGTVTKSGNLEFLMQHIPGSVYGEKLMQEEGRAEFPLAHARHWRPMLKHAPQAFHEAGSHVVLREGTKETFAYLHLNGADVTVLSANFEPFVEGVMTQIPMSGEVKIIAVTPNSILSTDKGTIIKHYAQEFNDKAVIFAGDGDSDIPAVGDKADLEEGNFLPSDVVACYFALEGGGFAKQLAEKGLPYLTYRKYGDIAVQLSELSTPRATTQPMTS
jgi:2-hydroxy-3-keto-5-methylthiopentenyl-1-phosphate phosphatase